MRVDCASTDVLESHCLASSKLTSLQCRERRNALLTAAVPQWSTCNPLVFDTGLLNERLEELLLARFKGLDALTKLIDDALQAGVASAPR